MERISLSTSTWKVSGYMARTFVDRLLGVRRAPAGAAVVIGARSVHGFGLRRPLEVVGLDARMRVVATATLRPNRVVVFRSARTIVELPSGQPVPERGDLVEVTRD
jgi:hypothetical protein